MDTICEVHGKQHYVNYCFGSHSKTLEKEKENDILKESLARKNGIKHYIVIDCREDNKTYIKNSILNSELSDLLDLNDLNWDDIFIKSNNSYVKDCADLWNLGYTTGEIVKALPISRCSVLKYLKRAATFNMCDYSVEEYRRKLNPKTTAVIYLTTGVIFNSMEKAKLCYSIKGSLITFCCKRKTKSAGKLPDGTPLRWQYYDEYIKQNQNTKQKVS